MPNPVVTITMTTGAKITLELLPENAPNTVNNFVNLVEQGFYNGLTFHRIIPNFMIQGGCPLGSGSGDPGYSIKGEFSGNGHANPLQHLRGVISMARAASPDSAGSQFFIMVAPAPHLDGQYAAFGQVTAGLETVDAIVSRPRSPQDRPLQEQRMETVTVETFGQAYPQPETISRT